MITKQQVEKILQRMKGTLDDDLLASTLGCLDCDYDHIITAEDFADTLWQMISATQRAVELHRRVRHLEQENLELMNK